jgi:hypothetical protein
MYFRAVFLHQSFDIDFGVILMNFALILGSVFDVFLCLAGNRELLKTIDKRFVFNEFQGWRFQNIGIFETFFYRIM